MGGWQGRATAGPFNFNPSGFHPDGAGPRPIPAKVIRKRTLRVEGWTAVEDQLKLLHLKKIPLFVFTDDESLMYPDMDCGLILNPHHQVEKLWRLTHRELAKVGGCQSLIKSRMVAWKGTVEQQVTFGPITQERDRSKQGSKTGNESGSFWNWLMCSHTGKEFSGAINYNRWAFLRMGVVPPPPLEFPEVDPYGVGIPNPTKESKLGLPNPLPKNLEGKTVGESFPTEIAWTPSQNTGNRIDSLRRAYKGQ